MGTMESTLGMSIPSTADIVAGLDEELHPRVTSTQTLSLFGQHVSNGSGIAAQAASSTMASDVPSSSLVPQSRPVRRLEFRNHNTAQRVMSPNATLLGDNYLLYFPQT